MGVPAKLITARVKAIEKLKQEGKIKKTKLSVHIPMDGKTLLGHGSVL